MTYTVLHSELFINTADTRRNMQFQVRLFQSYVIFKK